MSVFVPFRAFRPKKELVEKVSSKPYDVLNTHEARAESADNQWSFYRVIKPEIDLPDDIDPFSGDVYDKGRDNLKQLIAEGVLVQDTNDHFYVYRLKMGDHEQTGLVGCASIDDYFNNVIKKHELTKPHIEDDRKQHVISSEFNYEPVFFSYSPVEEINALIHSVTSSDPEYDFTAPDGVEHTLWLMKDEEMISRISELFDKKVPALYIADGHHRTAAGALAGRELRKNAGQNGGGEYRYDYLMCVAFPDDQIQILDYNRLVKDLNGRSAEDFLNEISSKFTVTKSDQPYEPTASDEIGMYLDRQWYSLKANPDTYDNNDPVDRLSFTILSKQILEPVLDIHDLRRDKRIDFVGGIRGLGELEKRVDSGEMTIGFAMHPIEMDVLKYVANNNLIMPPKVTWFEPKLRSGLFAHNLADPK